MQSEIGVETNDILKGCDHSLFYVKPFSKNCGVCWILLRNPISNFGGDGGIRTHEAVTPTPLARGHIRPL